MRDLRNASLLSLLSFLSILWPFAWVSMRWSPQDMLFAALFSQVAAPAGLALLVVVVMTQSSRVLHARDVGVVVALGVLACSLFVLTLPLSLLPGTLFAFCAFVGAQVMVCFAAAEVRSTDPRPLVFALLSVAGAASAPAVNLLFPSILSAGGYRNLLLLQAAGALFTSLGLTGSIFLFAWAAREARGKEAPRHPFSST